jgi:5'-nucleotidase
LETQPLILITNDDGIHSPGLRALIESVHDLGDILVVAPKRQHSSVGRAFLGDASKLTREDLGFSSPSIETYSMDASPALAVRHALLLVASRKPSLCLSGINYGENLGAGISISGTIGAAIEAASLGVPGIAISVQTDPEYHTSHDASIDFAVSAVFARSFAERLLAHGLPQGVDILKVDVPTTATADTPWHLTSTSSQPYWRSTVGRDTDGNKFFIGYQSGFDLDTLERDSDIYAFAIDHVVSVSPLAIHMRPCIDTKILQDMLCSPL